MPSARLVAVADYIPRCEAAADVGADHGFASAYLLEENRCALVYATDISDKALSRARSNLARLGCADRARFVCGDGIAALADLEPKPQAIMISGMGALTIVGILDAGLSTLERLRFPILSLSPNRDPELARGWLAAHGYAVARERVVNAAGRWYPVLRAEHTGAASMTIDPRTLYLGRTAEPPLSVEERQYWQWRLGVLEAQWPGGDKRGCGMFGTLSDRIGWVKDALS
jgi:tRNA (adenine22-N1)-methyltransferase